MADWAATVIELGQPGARFAPVLAILATRGFPVPADVKERILACTDLELLHRWTCQAVTASSLDDALK